MSDVLWTSEEAAGATGGESRGDWIVNGLSIDTRSLERGDLFIPLKHRRDGHDFIPQARAAGAGAVISEHIEEIAPALIVRDSVQTLNDLAVAGRDRCAARRIAVTGSVGKTSLKEVLAAICSRIGPTHKSQKSFNNHWGAPLTLASMPQQTEYGVFELGMNHAGELTELSKLVQPHIAIITKIAPAHLAHFENLDCIAAAKSEIFDGLEEGGVAILNADDAHFDFLKNRAESRGANILTFGECANADVRIIRPKVEAGKVNSCLVIDGKIHSMTLPIDGAHWIANGACAVAAAKAAGIDPQDTVKALACFQALPGRGNVIEARIDGKVITLIDESYNANPESMRAAISALSGRAAQRMIAVLGDMFELGKDELDFHAALAEPLRDTGVSRVIFIGECMRALKGVLPQEVRGAWARDWEIALDALREEIQDGDTVLVKGSNATGLGRLVEKIGNMNEGASHVL
ncbi:MAG: UDP-N-acetylmuramoyl-tripeptide--D-alanyl-D-alanine ligase [Hyphomonadaceae bacterium]|nr:UDP-N-acetylmuramoyl-tripeptide--D-alanyl-D-alanine ligase [Hyphomonadaceae bacterium]MBC6411998.1 UDP-N-acetylmuramoyl-tripeptide--D-alanyl-D-alanine ligase [Hyphomonadaceae bacterium]